MTEQPTVAAGQKLGVTPKGKVVMRFKTRIVQPNVQYFRGTGLIFSCFVLIYIVLVPLFGAVLSGLC